MSVLGPTAEILSLRKPSLVFALSGQPLAVQIRSKRICASPKESIQKKRHPDFALILRVAFFAGVGERGFLPLRQREASLPLPFGRIPQKNCAQDQSGIRVAAKDIKSVPTQQSAATQKLKIKPQPYADG
ncbi:hypothetical protein NP603_15635 [Methylomonas sp. SURF-1]|uniref:Uncharacterized protein n=1 Tax=Methylomonas aurea TaxID=2952224 RepID=A0ABT1UL26_9GAMM|nr:hypothetical protein [Methylomonas sp. SURF-1]MCQ8182553.1 hypothetical protein [Methylomonas sp. SURF-1]